MSEASSILAYGYRRATADLAPLGAGKRVYIDHDHRRRDRAQMLDDLRDGDVVRVLYLRDLGGSPVADRVWLERVEASGATVEEVRPPKPVKRMGRPSTLDPDAETAERLRVAWLDPARSLADRMQAVRDILGRDVTRQALYRRFGAPDKPK
jgi:hypothetical protein